MGSTGFDYLDGFDGTGEVAALLARLQEELSSRGAAARQLLAIAFDCADGKIEVVMRQQPLAEDYPDLAIVLGEIARTCTHDGIGPDQLKRMLFREDEIRLDVVDAWGEPQSYDYLIRPAILHS